MNAPTQIQQDTATEVGGFLIHIPTDHPQYAELVKGFVAGLGTKGRERSERSRRLAARPDPVIASIEAGIMADLKRAGRR